MNIYIGSAFTERFWCRTIAPVLIDRGWKVCSSWHGLTDHDVATMTEAQERDWAHKCFQELHEADVLLLLLAGHSEGGRWAEFGIAVAEHKKIVIVGDTKNVFRHLHNVSLREEEGWIDGIDAIWRKGQPPAMVIEVIGEPDDDGFEEPDNEFIGHCHRCGMEMDNHWQLETHLNRGDCKGVAT